MKTTWEIINIITQHGGKIEHINSFTIEDVTLTEKLFVKMAKDLGWNSEEHYCETEDELLEEGYFENNNYDSISLVWSIIKHN